MSEKRAESKQAYLIIAHKDNFSFRTLIKMLDDERNDIFIHMDIKNKGYDPAQIEELTHYSNIIHTKRTDVTWGGYSQINSELLLLKAATAMGQYQHYHLLSGGDLPIKTKDEIIRFFNEHEGKEFIRFEKEFFMYDNRTRYYHLFQEHVGRSHNIILRGGNLLFLTIQKLLHIHRNKNICFQKGTSWFSITDKLARYVLFNERWIKKTFKYSYCCDEIFLQTIVVNSDFKNNLYHKAFDNDSEAIMRLVDWNRGKPYTFRLPDYHELYESDMMFARKFDSDIDKEIVEKIYKFFHG